MALFTCHIDMRAVQGEVAAVVVKGDAVPTCWHMTGRTVCSKTTTVFIVLLMARITIRRCPFIDTILMARFASHFGMLAFQFES